MRAQDRTGGGKFDEDVAIGHGVHRVLRDLRPAFGIHEAEGLRGEFAVDRQRRAGNGPRPQRTPVGLGGDFAEPLPIAFQHLQPGQEVVREKDRLGPLEVGVSRNQYVAVGLRQIQQRPLRPGEFLLQHPAGMLEK